MGPVQGLQIVELAGIGVGSGPGPMAAMLRIDRAEIDAVVQPVPAPRFSRSVPRTPTPPRDKPNTDIAGLLAAWREGR